MRQTDETRTDRTRNVEIPERTAQTIADRISEMEFESVDAYVSYALDQLLWHAHRQELGDTGPVRESEKDGESSSDDGANEEVEDRLESLGYL